MRLLHLALPLFVTASACRGDPNAPPDASVAADAATGSVVATDLATPADIPAAAEGGATMDAALNAAPVMPDAAPVMRDAAPADAAMDVGADLASADRPDVGRDATPPPDLAPDQAPPVDPGLMPQSIAFGSVLIGRESAPRTITFTNTRSTQSPRMVVTMSGNSGQFGTPPTSTPCGPPLPPAGTCHITVVFSPTTRGAKEAYLLLWLEGESPRSAWLTGTGL